MLFAVGYDRSAAASTQSIEEVYAGGMRNVLAALPLDIGRFIYISTTGVYGPASGEWVDETTPPDPRRDGGRASLAAEQVLAAHPLGARSVILRLAGIYGPDRVPFIKELRAGQPIPAPASGYLNLIHVDDAAEVVVEPTVSTGASRHCPATANPPRIYCVSDGNPVERGEYYSEVARQIGVPPPRFIDARPEFSARGTSREQSPHLQRPHAGRATCDARISRLPGRACRDSFELRAVSKPFSHRHRFTESY